MKMMLVFVSSFFCILNIILWFFFLSKFKSYFSTDEILEKTKQELDEMISDVNRNAGRNLDLIEDRIKELRAVVAEADRHIAFAQAELEKQKNLASFQQKIDTVSTQKPSGNYKQAVAEKYKRNSSNLTGRQSTRQASAHSDDTYRLTPEGKQHIHEEAELFDSVQNEKEIVSDAGTVFSVENSAPSVTKVPVFGPEVAYADSPVEPKKSFSEMVRDLSLVGHSVEEIAVELGRSTTEVQMVLDMNF